MAAINSRDMPSWLVAAVSEKLSGSTLLLLLHSLPRAPPAGRHLPLHLPKSLTSGSVSCCYSLVLVLVLRLMPSMPSMMVRYSWWRQSFGVIVMAPNFPHSIFDPWSCTGTEWIVHKVIMEHSLHSVLICDIHTARFSLDCCQAAVCPCTLLRLRCHQHSDGCARLYMEPRVSCSCLDERYSWVTPSILPAKSESLHQCEMKNKVER